MQTVSDCIRPLPYHLFVGLIVVGCLSSHLTKLGTLQSSAVQTRTEHSWKELLHSGQSLCLHISSEAVGVRRYNTEQPSLGWAFLCSQSDSPSRLHARSHEAHLVSCCSKSLGKVWLSLERDAKYHDYPHKFQKPSADTHRWAQPFTCRALLFDSAKIWTKIYLKWATLPWIIFFVIQHIKRTSPPLPRLMMNSGLCCVHALAREPTHFNLTKWFMENWIYPSRQRSAAGVNTI